MSWFLPVPAHCAVGTCAPVLCKPDVEGAGGQASVLPHAASLGAGQDIEAVSVSAADVLLDWDNSSSAVDGHAGNDSLLVRSCTSKGTQAAAPPPCLAQITFWSEYISEPASTAIDQTQQRG